MPKANACILWFRQDLRLDDNAALEAALLRGGPIIPVYIWSPKDEREWPMGAASKWWLHHSLKSLDNDLRARGSKLIIRRGQVVDELCKLVDETSAKSVFWSRRWEPAARKQEVDLQRSLFVEGAEGRYFNSSLLCNPAEILKISGAPFRVFTPFFRRCLSMLLPGVSFVATREISRPTIWPASLAIDDLDLLPKIDWAQGLREEWQPGEAGARMRLNKFLKEASRSYLEVRNRTDQDGISKLSPHLHFGEIGPRQIISAIRERGIEATGFLRQLIWREFAYYLLYHFPDTPTEPLDKRFSSFPWQVDSGLLNAWRRGRTGYPMVDAGMRQLWRTGYMHNRARLVAASFLAKDLLISWTEGAKWFWDTLVDADLANNTLGWQWIAGCGADAAPFFRIFNPVTQGEKFDPDGHYVRRWVPELKELDTKWIHRPWEASTMELLAAGVILGETYPSPIVNHASARKRALKVISNISLEAICKDP